jgi:heptosyltransferase I
MLSAVGDAVHVLPVVNAIKRADKGAHVTWIVQPGPAALVDGHPAIDTLVRFDRRRGWRAFLDMRHTGPFDSVWDLQTYLKAGLVTALTPARTKLGFDRARARDLNWLFTTAKVPARSWRRHMQDQYLEFLDVLGVPAAPVVWDLGPRGDERAWQAQFFAGFDRPVVPLVIGSTRTAKNWPAERWAAVADALVADFGVVPVMVGGDSAAEQEVARRIRALARHPVADALGSGLRRLVAIMDGAPLVVSLDTGPLHIAVALDRPVVSLIGYNDPAIYGPYGRFHDLVVNGFGEPSRRAKETRPGGMMRVSVRDVLDRVERWRTSYRS